LMTSFLKISERSETPLARWYRWCISAHRPEIALASAPDSYLSVSILRFFQVCAARFIFNLFSLSGLEYFKKWWTTRRSSQVSSGVEKQLKKHGLHLEEGERVCWNDDNEGHPRNWSLYSKAYNNALIFWLEFFMTFISTSGVKSRILKSWPIAILMVAL